MKSLTILLVSIIFSFSAFAKNWEYSQMQGAFKVTSDYVSSSKITIAEKGVTLVEDNDGRPVQCSTESGDGMTMEMHGVLIIMANCPDGKLIGMTVNFNGVTDLSSFSAEVTHTDYKNGEKPFSMTFERNY